ncbi:MAG: MlaD family protein [Niabella sp.]
MKISNELKVGLLALVAIIALIIGFNFLKGKDFFNRTTKIYAVFKSVGGLEKSNFVKINGLTVGTVYDMEPADADLSAIKVTLNITQNVNIPANSVAFIEGSLLGTANVVIEKGNATKYLKNGDNVATRLDNGLLGDLTSEAKPLIGKVRNMADSMTLLLANVNNTLDAPTQRNLQYVIANLNHTAETLNTLLTGLSKPLNATMENMNSISGNLKNNNQQIQNILSNANTFTGNLKTLELEKTLAEMNGTLAELKTTLLKVTNPNGSIGAMMNDKQLYDRLNKVALSAEILLDDLRVHPKRYVNISVFGKKNKAGELTAPAVKDTIPQ